MSHLERLQKLKKVQASVERPAARTWREELLNLKQECKDNWRLADYLEKNNDGAKKPEGFDLGKWFNTDEYAATEIAALVKNQADAIVKSVGAAAYQMKSDMEWQFTGEQLSDESLLTHCRGVLKKYVPETDLERHRKYAGAMRDFLGSDKVTTILGKGGKGVELDF